jgi:CHAT domain-containing protein
MARAFFYAGAPRVVSGLWEIPADNAKYITGLFYKSIQEQSTCAEAITKAKRTYLNTFKGENQHPAHWAGLVLVGNYNSLKIK